MKKYLSLILVCFGVKILLAQKTVATYYDQKKSIKKEEYVTDAKGIKNGNYKLFNEVGELLQEGIYKNGKKNGIFIEYTKYPNYIGKPQLKSKINYIDDLKEGQAIFYEYSNDLAVYESKKGIFKNNKEEGVWVKVTPFVMIFTPAEYDKIKIIPAFADAMGVKSNSIYKGGEEIMPEGKEVVYYYPSNKIYHSYQFRNNKLIGTDLYLFPDGKPWSKTVYNDSSKYLSILSYYYSGKIKEKEIMKPYFYEGYNEDGSPNKVMVVKNNEEMARKTKEEELNKAVIDANKLAAEEKSLQAMNLLEAQIKQYIEWKTLTFNYSAQDPDELIAAKAALEKIKHPVKTK
jgi:antitoxin component YwqK of YwqJK toxin-antitoxin module